MLGRRSRQRGLFEGGNLYLDFVGPKTFGGFLAMQREELFRDDGFAEMYCVANGSERASQHAQHRPAHASNLSVKHNHGEAVTLADQCPGQSRFCWWIQSSATSGGSRVAGRGKPDQVGRAPRVG